MPFYSATGLSPFPQDIPPSRLRCRVWSKAGRALIDAFLSSPPLTTRVHFSSNLPVIRSPLPSPPIVPSGSPSSVTLSCKESFQDDSGVYRSQGDATFRSASPSCGWGSLARFFRNFSQAAGETLDTQSKQKVDEKSHITQPHFVNCASPATSLFSAKNLHKLFAYLKPF